jgi:dihydrofolate reductase
MVSSLDGFIAKKDGSVSWLNSTDNYKDGISLSDEEISNFLKKIDCYVMGFKTYETALDLGWPYGDIPVIVLTHKTLVTEKTNVKFYSGDLQKLVSDQLKSNYRNIWLVGGPVLVKDFLRLKLADEIIISIIPIILGDGLLFFDFIGVEQKLHLKDVTAYNDGIVELVYDLIKD